jgi:hypothetical protein
MPILSIEDYKPEITINFHRKIRFHSKLSHGERMFYIEMSAMTKNALCPYAPKKLAPLFKVCHQTIINYVKNLIKLELLEFVINSEDSNGKKFLKVKTPS